jgi:hypothetical protein
LLFFREYADVYLYIINPENNEEFHVGVLISVLYGFRIEMFSEIGDPYDRMDKQLTNYTHYLTGALGMLLNGDFSCSESYRLFSQNL